LTEEPNAHSKAKDPPHVVWFIWSFLFVGLSAITVYLAAIHGLGTYGTVAISLALVALGLLVWTVVTSGKARLIYLIAATACLMIGGFLGLTWRVISGKVACASHLPVVGVFVHAANGGSNFAARTQSSGWSANYTFTLRFGGKYSLSVGCGGGPGEWRHTDNGPVVSGSHHSFICLDDGHAGLAGTCSTMG
jgi:fucose 4-O-acetylase-like acetyltransferase